MSDEPKYVIQEILRLYRGLSEPNRLIALEAIGVKQSKKLYKLLHKPTGLFYKPLARYDSNLGIVGKIYKNKPRIPQGVSIKLYSSLKTKEGSLTDKIEKYFNLTGYVNEYIRIPVIEWEIIEI